MSLFALAAVILLASPADKPAAKSEKNLTAKELRAAPEKISIRGCELEMDTYLWRDFQPISPAGGKNLIAVVKVEPATAKEIPEGTSAATIWVLNGNDVWKGELKEVRSKSPVYEALARGGPKWGPNIYVDVVVQVRDKDGKTYLLQSPRQKIHRTD